MTEKEEGVREIERERQIERHRWREPPRGHTLVYFDVCL